MNLQKLDFRTDVLPFVLATAGEFAALFFWLHYLDQGRFWLANGILWAGFLVERISVVVWIRTIYRKKEQISVSTPILAAIFGLIGITLSEILIWVFWVTLADERISLGLGPSAAFALAAVVLMGLMQVEHSVEMGVLKRRSPREFLLNPPTIFFTFLEVAGAVAWLYFVRSDQLLLGGLCLLVGLSIEHVLQGSGLRPDEVPAPAPAPKAAAMA